MEVQNFRNAAEGRGHNAGDARPRNTPAGSGRPKPDRAGFRVSMGGIRHILGVCRWLGFVIASVLISTQSANSQDNHDKGSIVTLDEVVVTASRLSDRIAGSSTTVIAASDTERSPGRTLPEIMSFEAGVRFRDLYGSNNGVGQIIDVRGFGEPSTPNTLILINGRRLTDLDIAAVDFSSIPLGSIGRIEILRGNFGSVLYGSGVQGGVINIITKTDSAPGIHGDARTRYGSDDFRGAGFSVSQGAEAYSMSVFGNYVSSDGYRENNDLKQKNLTAELRRHGGQGDLFVHLDSDNQRLGLPGGRLVDPSTGQNDLANPKEAQTPNDFAFQNGTALVLGGNFEWTDGVELVLDASVRRKDQDSDFRNQDQSRDTVLTTWGFTPRINLDALVFDKALSSIMGFDLYYVDYNSDRKRNPQSAPFARVEGRQSSFAVYAQNTLEVTPRLSITGGARLERFNFTAGDTAFPNNPGSFGFPQTTFRPSLTDIDVEYAWNLGFDHDLGGNFGLYGHVGRGYRTPMIDERSGTAFALNTFELNNQLSQEVEAGFRAVFGGINVDTRAYFTKTKNEIRFDPDDSTAFGANENVDPIHRYGLEATAGTKLLEGLSLNGNLTFMRARFASGQFSGKDVPLVPNAVLSGGLSWKVLDWLTLDTTLTYEADRRLANDEAGTFPELSGYSIWDLKLGGSYKFLQWSAAIQNLLDEEYQNFGTASDTTPGRFSVQTLPGRTFMLSIGAKL